MPAMSLFSETSWPSSCWPVTPSLRDLCPFWFLDLSMQGWDNKIAQLVHAATTTPVALGNLPRPALLIHPQAKLLSTVRTWRHRLSCHCRAAGYLPCRRVPPLFRTTGLRWGSPRSLSSSSFSVPSSPYASGPSSSSRTIPSTNASPSSLDGRPSPARSPLDRRPSSTPSPSQLDRKPSPSHRSGTLPSSSTLEKKHQNGTKTPSRSQKRLSGQCRHFTFSVLI